MNALIYTDDYNGLFATTHHGEFGCITGPARDPARCKFMPHPNTHETEWFTPRLADLTFAPVGIMRAQHLATQEERARAWDALMSSTDPNTDNALMHACEVLCDAVTYRLNHHSNSPQVTKVVAT
jgi:hypothetical protein